MHSYIKQLLDNGYSEEELIASLTKAVPHLAQKAKKMFFGGWSPKDVINYFSKDKDAEKAIRKGLKPVTASEIARVNLQNSFNSIPKPAEEQTKETLQNFTKQVASSCCWCCSCSHCQYSCSYALSRSLPQNLQSGFSQKRYNLQQMLLALSPRL